MSGGVAFVWDPLDEFESLANQEMVALEELVEEEDLELVHRLIVRHLEYTRSPVAEKLLQRWPSVGAEFVKIMPRDYRRVLEEMARAEAEGAPPELMEGARG